MTEKITQGKNRRPRLLEQPAAVRDNSNSPRPLVTIMSSRSTPGSNPPCTEETDTPIEEGQAWVNNDEPNTADSWKTATEESPSATCKTVKDNIWPPFLELAQPEQVNTNLLFEQHFVGQFVQSVTTARFLTYPDCPQSWFLELPNFLSMDVMPSLKYAIRAAALVYFAVAHRHKQAEIDAMRWYSAGLECHRATLQQSRTRASAEKGSDDKFSNLLPSYLAICVPLLFQYFETMKEITADIRSAHYTAATEIIRSRGPFDCRAGIGHRIFRSMRHYEAFHSIWQNRPSWFDSSDWSTIPFTDHPKIFPDLLIDILLSFSRELHLPSQKPGETIRDCIRNLSVLSVDAKLQIEKDVLVLMSRLQNWQWHFSQANGVWLQFPDSPIPTTTVPSENGCPREIDTNITSTQDLYRDTFTSYCIAVYGAAMIILHSILLVIAVSNLAPVDFDSISPIPRHRSVIASYSASVLQVAVYQRLVKPHCGDSVRTLSAVKVVAALAVEDQQRHRACELACSWRFGTTEQDSFSLSNFT
ncbi:uncharacterized protein Z519_11910 [Cladophialophora bantiana CBS 173.52]|uniref:Transcription factor domain-containing protein n=1 Tax=Cladophialophora bantiana (strain ATCC 10958 / CBS 173.52 / CDC B-1940 / NIH 8579) TaxID=1442370 RepID=A0A0D2H9N8_CLAB1|nr:uncharacterized protein Z519_11910 [Cladophialophora bantiana CBS 173.52]KIW87585.1 hypothetical protein Z519_11910 [Cladophialophora bantiana CBS 173.52]